MSASDNVSGDTKAARPLSPHLQVYRPQFTSALSIFHRITGIALAVGTLLLTYWLVAIPQRRALLGLSLAGCCSSAGRSPFSTTCATASGIWSGTPVTASSSSRRNAPPTPY